MSNAIVPAQNAIIRTMDDAERAAISMAKSGYFTDSRDAAQAVVKILAGQEMGFGPFASMTGIYIIQGRPSVSANLMAAAVKKSGRYNYRVIEMTNEVCEIAFFEGGSEVGRSRFTLDDARKAQTKNLDKFPRNMLFARAMSNGVRWYCPDVFNGAPTYTPEELGANVNEEGEVIIDAPVVIREEPAPKNGNGKWQIPPELIQSNGEEAQNLIDNEISAEANGDRPEPKRKGNAGPTGTMSLEAASAITNREGVPYGSLDSETLSHMANSLTKALKKEGLTVAQKDEMKLKRDAIGVILSSR